MNDIIGSVGVALILLAYFLGTEKLMKTDSKIYFVLNIIGAGLATTASLMIGYWPFVILKLPDTCFVIRAHESHEKSV